MTVSNRRRSESSGHAAMPWLLALVLLPALTAGCGKDPVAPLRSLQSWAASSMMIGRAWADGATPRAYTLRALERAQRELAAQLRELRRAPADQRTAATPAAERVLGSVAEAIDAVRAGDRERVRAATAALSGEARELRKLARGTAPGS
jgi:hypothetical protein